MADEATTRLKEEVLIIEGTDGETDTRWTDGVVARTIAGKRLLLYQVAGVPRLIIIVVVVRLRMEAWEEDT